MTQRRQPGGMTFVLVLFLILLTGLTALALHTPPKLNRLSEVLLKAHRYDGVPVALEGYVRNLYTSREIHNQSFDFLSDNRNVAVRSGAIPVPPKNSKIILYGYFQMGQASPYIVEHIVLQSLKPADSHWWFMELDRRARGLR